jgi:hypothetical protein
MVEENLRRVQQRIAAAARAAGRDPAEVRLVCVTKGVPAERIREAVAAGVREIGENRVQEAREKRVLLGTVPFGDSPLPRWHLIGRLQRNKAKLAAQLFDVIHSVDSLELVEALVQRERLLEVLIQVNVSGEATKGGCRPEKAEALAEAVLKTKSLKWAGLMTMAPYNEDPEEARPVFRRLRELRDKLADRFRTKLDLSMGMSGDFETAVQEGATMVRIGTAIFGERA